MPGWQAPKGHGCGIAMFLIWLCNRILHYIHESTNFLLLNMGNFVFVLCHVCKYECGMIERYDFVILDGILVIGVLRKCIKSGVTKEITFKIKASIWYW